MLLGNDSMNRLWNTRVIVFGVGGVGSWAAEGLIRTGLGRLTIVDFDRISASNINRQLPATTDTIGLSKVTAMRNRLLSINPDAEITAIDGLYSPDTAAKFDLNSYDYVIDAIDSLRDKTLLINNATRSSARLFSSMGAALKTDPTKIGIAEFWKVSGCRLAAALRQRFKRSGVFPAKKFNVVYSPEIVENRHVISDKTTDYPIRKPIINGSLVQITAVFGMTLVSMVINDIAENSPRIDPTI